MRHKDNNYGFSPNDLSGYKYVGHDMWVMIFLGQI